MVQHGRADDPEGAQVTYRSFVCSAGGSPFAGAPFGSVHSSSQASVGVSGTAVPPSVSGARSARAAGTAGGLAGCASVPLSERSGTAVTVELQVYGLCVCAY
jgi:hypothetical protein